MCNIYIESKVNLVPYMISTLETLCERYGFSYQIGENIIFITTRIAAWCLLFDGNKIELLHRNLKYSLKSYQHTALRNDYHLQKVKYDTVEKYLQYIYQHDKK